MVSCMRRLMRTWHFLMTEGSTLRWCSYLFISISYWMGSSRDYWDLVYIEHSVFINYITHVF